MTINTADRGLRFLGEALGAGDSSLRSLMDESATAAVINLASGDLGQDETDELLRDIITVSDHLALAYGCLAQAIEEATGLRP